MELFDWDEANVDHLALHGIAPEEAEQVVEGEPYVLGVELRNGELRRRELGATLDGRILVIVTIARGYKIRVVTGWPPDKGLRGLWQKIQEEAKR